MLKKFAGIAVTVAMGFAILAVASMIEVAPPRPAIASAAIR